MFDKEREPAMQEKIFLTENEAHIWQIELNRTDEIIKNLPELLDETERAKALSFRFGKDKRNYITAHCGMREILSFYLGICPQNIEFEANFYGKPFLRRNDIDLRFNLSHSHERALLAVTRGKEIGVDIELIRNSIAEENLAEQFFSPLEAETLRNLPKGLQTKAFFDCWTRKEAFIKAVGKGLSYPLKDFTVAFTPSERARLIALENSPIRAEDWQIVKLNVAEDYAAAMAVEAQSIETKLYLWNFSKSF